MNSKIFIYSTCAGHKRQPLSSEYPTLCPTIEAVADIQHLCGSANRWRPEPLGNRSLSRAIETEIYNYARENLAIINIFIKEPYTKRFRKTEKMSRISFIASSGGLLGMTIIKEIIALIRL